jgi:flagellin
MIVNHNIAAMDALNNLTATGNAMDLSLQKLSSGLKIVTAADDAAGLAISQKLTAQTNALGQAKLNAQDGLSMLQTADGSLNVTQDILQRLNTLAVRSANDATLTASDKTLITSEVGQLTSELDRMSSTVTFNTKNLLDGTFTAEDLQVGAGATANDQIAVSITGVDSTTLGVDTLDLSTVAGSQAAITSITKAIDTVSANRGQIGAVENRLNETVTNLGNEITNTTASVSRIQDVDMAAEMSNFTRLQVMQQAGTAMLAQANSLPQSVLSLLK